MKSNELNALDEIDLRALARNKDVLMHCFKKLRLADLIAFFEYLDDQKSLLTDPTAELLSAEDRKSLIGDVNNINVPTDHGASRVLV